MRTVTVTIDESGDQVFLSNAADVFGEHGTYETHRGSHVVPVSVPLRVAFKALRAVVSDKSAVAAWTRTWRCEWQVEIVNGTTLKGMGGWYVRQEAISAEIEYLNEQFLEEK
jgi:hypothetical protein